MNTEHTQHLCETVDASADVMKLAEMILSDCGCSTAISDRLQRRVAGRIQLYVDNATQQLQGQVGALLAAMDVIALGELPDGKYANISTMMYAEEACKAAQRAPIKESLTADRQAEPVAYLKTAAGVMQLSFEGNPVVAVGADIEVPADTVQPLFAHLPAQRQAVATQLVCDALIAIVSHSGDPAGTVAALAEWRKKAEVFTSKPAAQPPAQPQAECGSCDGFDSGCEECSGLGKDGHLAALRQLANVAHRVAHAMGLPAGFDVTTLPDVVAQRLAAQPPAVAVPTIKLGLYGRAFDTPQTCRAYTYQHQPDNLDAYNLGRAAASTSPGGDNIDRGLSLLKELQAHGFGVFELGDQQEGGAA